MPSLLCRLRSAFDSRLDERAPNLLYLGSADSADSVEAFQAFLASGHRPTEAWILSVVGDDRQGDHAIYFEVDLRGYVIRGGLTSGYVGTGPKALATVLGLFNELECYPADVIVPRSYLAAASSGALTYTQVEAIKHKAAWRRGSGRHYIDIPYYRSSEAWDTTPVTMPMGLLDSRLRPIALQFFDDPDIALLKASRELEHIIRMRLGQKNFNDKGDAISGFLSVAFGGSGVLVWPGLEQRSVGARLALFESTFSLIRNQRAHRPNVGNKTAFEELMLLNMLFVYESLALRR